VEKIWGWNDSFQREIHKQKFIAHDIKLIEHNEKKIGFIVIKETDLEIYIENLLIEQNFQNLGIGKLVMEPIIKRAKTKKKQIRLQVFKINSKAQRFYVNLGFEKISDLENHIEMKKF
jgi:ribosomal protein S18 acetylase RimI-like enzyme